MGQSASKKAVTSQKLNLRHRNSKARSFEVRTAGPAPLLGCGLHRCQVHLPRIHPQVVETTLTVVKRAKNEIDLKQVNDYKFGKLLGTGSYGLVYEVRRVLAGRPWLR